MSTNNDDVETTTSKEVEVEEDSNPVENFLKTTTAHGFYKVSESKKRPIRRAIWLMVILATMTGCAVHVSMVTLRYYSYPMASKQYQETQLATFPDVTVCFNTPISKAQVNNPVPSLGNKTFANLATEVHRFWNCLVKDRITLTNSKENKELLVDRFVQSTLVSFAVEAKVLQDVKNSMLFCEKGGVSCNMTTDFKETFHPSKWACQTYMSSLKPQDHIRGTELEMTFFQLTENTRYDASIENRLRNEVVEGATVIIHSPGTIPLGSNHEVNVANALVVNVRMTKFTEDNTPKNICRPPNETISVLENGQKKTYLYNLQACEDLALQETVWNKCSCLSEDLPVLYDERFFRAPYCHAMSNSLAKSIFKEDCVNDTQTSLTNSCYISLSRYPELETIVKRARCYWTILNTWDSSSVSCKASCNRDEYSSVSHHHMRAFRGLHRMFYFRTAMQEKQRTLSANGLPTDLAEAVLAKTSNFRDFILRFPDNFQKMRIDLTSVMGNRIEETMAYPLPNFLSDIGGVLGLWIGCSIITVLEISEFSLNVANKAADKTRQSLRLKSVARKALLKSRVTSKQSLFMAVVQKKVEAEAAASASAAAASTNVTMTGMESQAPIEKNHEDKL